MRAGRPHVAVKELRKAKFLYICHLDYRQIILGVLFDFALDFDATGSESFVEEVIPFVLAASFSNLMEHRSGSAGSIEDLFPSERHCSKSLLSRVTRNRVEISFTILELLIEKGEPR
jgi:hypothetical protein